eukprot:696852-Hanusia_phi.AAC.1
MKGKNKNNKTQQIPKRNKRFQQTQIPLQMQKMISIITNKQPKTDTQSRTAARPGEEQGPGR